MGVLKNNPPEQFVVNQQLIDMSYIPSELQKKVAMNLEEYFNHE